METTKAVVSSLDIGTYNGDLLVCIAAAGEDGGMRCDERIRSLLAPLVQCEDFAGKEGETALFYPEKEDGKSPFAAKRLLVVGVGSEEKGEALPYALSERFRCCGGTIGKLCEKLKAKDVLLAPAPELGLPHPQVIEYLVEGILLADYRFGKYKTPDKENPPYAGLKRLLVAAANQGGALRKAVRRAAAAAAAVASARDMANEPGNGWTPTQFAEHASALAKKYAMSCRVIEKEQMQELGMGGLLAVNQGSVDPPKLVILEYSPQKRETGDTLLLVGKGLTFDSGGLSLKPAAGMEDMKYDMCGGAAVLATMQAIGERRPPVRVVALVPSTDNMAGSSAIKPGDVIRHYNGVSSEIVNTDAEGRLILADALAYGIKQYKPACAIDVATLTGAAIIALGHHHTAVLGNDDKLIAKLIEAGKKTGEPLWRLPLVKEYGKQLESRVADVKNAGGRPGGTITAAAYLEKFVGETPWAHLDIAGTAWDFTEKSYIPKGPSGIMVRTLLEFVCGWSD